LSLRNSAVTTSSCRESVGAAAAWSADAVCANAVDCPSASALIAEAIVSATWALTLVMNPPNGVNECDNNGRAVAAGQNYPECDAIRWGECRNVASRPRMQRSGRAAV